MKHHPPNRSGVSAFPLIVLVVLCCILPLLLAEAPSWWSTRGVLKTDTGGQPVPASDFAAANQGQLKNVAIAAYEEFLAKIPAELGGIGADTPPVEGDPNDKGSPGWRLRNLVSQWVQINRATGKILRADLDAQDQPTGTYSTNGTGARQLAPSAAAQNDYTAINQGQIKAVAAPFYERLAELYWSYNSATPATSQIDPAWAKPWTETTDDDNSYAMANLGQLKRVFAIHLDSDADGDGLTNLDELLKNKNRHNSDRAKWTDLANRDTNGDGRSDKDDILANADPTDSDSDHDGVPNSEDKFPLDPRRSDYYQAKFYAVTELSQYLPANVRATFEPQHIALDDSHNVAFFGTSQPSINFAAKGYVYKCRDGVLSSDTPFDMRDPADRSTRKPMSAADLSRFTDLSFGGPATEGFVESFLFVSGINSTGKLATAASTDYSATTTYTTPPLPGYPLAGWDAGAGLISCRTPEWPLTAIPWPAGWIPKKKGEFWANNGGEDPPLFLGETVAVDNAGHTLAWDQVWVPPPNQVSEGFYRYRTLFGGPNETPTAIPELSEDPSTRDIALFEATCYGLNNHGAFLVRGKVAEGTASMVVSKYCEDGVLHDAPAGIVPVQMNGASGGLHQAIGRADYVPVSGMGTGTFSISTGTSAPVAKFAFETSSGDWTTMPLLDLLKWTHKPSDTRDDYDIYHAALRNIRPKFIADADSATVGKTITVNERPFSNGMPRCIAFSAWYADGDQYDTTTWTKGNFVLQLDTSDPDPGQWHYKLKTIWISPGFRAPQLLAMNSSGSMAAIVQSEGTSNTPGKTVPAFMVGFDFTADIAKLKSGAVALDPPMVGIRLSEPFPMSRTVKSMKIRRFGGPVCAGNQQSAPGGRVCHMTIRNST